MNGIKKANHFTPAQAQQLDKYLVRRILIEQDDSHKSYVDNVLAELKVTTYLNAVKMGHSRSRHAQHCPLLEFTATRNLGKERWQYWLYRTNAKDAPRKCHKALATISNERISMVLPPLIFK